MGFRASSLFLAVFVISLAIPIGFSHQPILVMDVTSSEANPIIIENPEISRAFYSELTGTPEYYKIVSSEPFTLYIGLLVPDVSPYNKSIFSADVISDEKILFSLSGSDAQWSPFFESFAGDYYLQGPEIKKSVPAGNYTLRIFNENNSGRYSLAVGERDAFGLSEILNAIVLVPQLKQKFFGKSPVDSYANFYGFATVLFIILIIYIVFRIVLIILRKK
jgi:hypothetical protein